MEHIMKWISEYSAPMVMLFAFGACLIFILKKVVENAVSSKFEERNKRLEQLLQRRMKFEEKVLLDQYQAVTDLKLRLGKITADLRRTKDGIKVEGLLQGSDIVIDVVPLSDVFIDLEAKHFLLRDEFYNLLHDEANTLIEYANEKDPDKSSKLEQHLRTLNDKFVKQMNATFDLEKISGTAI